MPSSNKMSIQWEKHVEPKTSQIYLQLWKLQVEQGNQQKHI